MARTPAGTPNDPRGAERFNEERAAYTVSSAQPDLEGGVQAIRDVVKVLKPVPGVYRMCDARGEAIIIAIANLRGRHRIVFIDHGHCAALQQSLKCRSGVEVTPPLLTVLKRQKNLRDGYTMLLKQSLVGLCQTYLPNCGGGLTVF